MVKTCWPHRFFYFGVQKALVTVERDSRSRPEENCLASGRPAANRVPTAGLTGCIIAAGGGRVRREQEEEEEVSVAALRTTRLLNFLFLGDGRYLD